MVTARPASPFVGPFDAQESPARHSTKPSRLLPSPAPRNCRPLLDPGPQSGLPQQQSHAGPSPAPAALACPPGLVWGSDHVPSAWPVRGRASHGDHSPACLLSPLPGRPGGRQTPPGPGPLPRQRRARRRRALNASPPQGRAEAASPGAGAAGAPACSRGPLIAPGAGRAVLARGGPAQLAGGYQRWNGAGGPRRPPTPAQSNQTRSPAVLMYSIFQKERHDFNIT
uniref:Uncharacterized protein n=1 Tax=Rangifer tarandus platyrhynchus TaxID=3082113 RepID=A0ACB0F3S2_RANTA|nr:unnamed protein product [Rangifer tarandus platyrhynchus]